MRRLEYVIEHEGEYYIKWHQKIVWVFTIWRDRGRLLFLHPISRALVKRLWRLAHDRHMNEQVASSKNLCPYFWMRGKGINNRDKSGNDFLGQHID
jgi:hypothetical protein